MSDLLWRSRLGHSLPEPLLNTFKLSRRPWSQQVSTFYSTNLVSNAIFSSSGFSVATGIGESPLQYAAGMFHGAAWLSLLHRRAHGLHFVDSYECL